MAMATATLDFDSYGKLMRPVVPVEAPALEALRSCAQLQAAPVEALKALARDATLRPLNRGATIVAQGGRLDAAILVVRGKIRAVCRAVNGREISVEMFRAGDLIADGALAPETPLANDWEAVEASALLMIPREAFLACLRATPELALVLGAGLVERLERSKQLATGLALVPLVVGGNKPGQEIEYPMAAVILGGLCTSAGMCTNICYSDGVCNSGWRCQPMYDTGYPAGDPTVLACAP